ncbi:MAG: hypothetical protein IJM15_06055, partial [Erysipelotrichaceae bacterium]|nr:hypothetical protein [Erysipelotrichaceae bacterium]
MTRLIKKLLMISLALMFCFTAFSGIIIAEETNGDDGTITVQATFDLRTTDTIGKWDFEYNDQWFGHSAQQYDHRLARVSLGMAISAFRPNLDPDGKENPASHLQMFLSKCKFENLRTDDYDKEPSLYTVASVIGSKHLQDEQGDYVLIAVGVCGGGYKDEAMSNFSMSDGDIHLGFYSAASAMYDRVFGYIAQNQLSGKRFKIWISGYSRAAAVGNVLSKLLVDSDIFDTDTVFNYNFATPRTTKNPQEGSYPNIYNICGKMDPVSQVTFADWGYDRFGTTLYTPAQQTDSDYNVKVASANTVHKAATGVDFFNNVEWDTRLRVILNYILKIIPNQKVYTEHMMDIIIKMWDDKRISNIMTCLMEIAGDEALINESNEKEANRLLTYILYTVYGYMTHSDVESKYRSEDATAVANLTREHTPEVYISWLFSNDDPSKIYSNSVNYLRIVVDGDVDVAITSAVDHELYKCMKSDGMLTDEFELDGKNITKMQGFVPDVFMERTNGQHIIILPKDMEYSIIIKSNKQQTVEVHAIALKVGYTNDNLNKSHYAEMKTGDCDILFSSESNDIDIEGYSSFVEGDTFDLVDIYRGDASELLFDIEKANIFNLSWRQIVILAFVIPIFLIALICFIVITKVEDHALSLKKRRGMVEESERYNPAPVAVICAAVVLFALQEILYWLMPNYMFHRAVLKLLINLILIYLCYVGYKRQPTRLSRHLIIALIMCMVADIMINFDFSIGIVLYALTEAFFVYAFTRYDKQQRWQWILWLFNSAISLIIIINSKAINMTTRIQMAGYAMVLMALVSAALTMPRKIRFGAILLVIANILMYRNEVAPLTLLSHVLSIGIYYIAIGLFAFSSRYKELRVLSLWKEDAPARQQLMSFMKSVTDRDSDEYIPIENRIAVFDLDGTLFCETDPNYFDYT